MRPSPEFTQNFYRLKVWHSDGTVSQSFRPYYSSIRSYSGVQTPGYHDKKKKGLLPVNPFSSNVVTKVNFGEVSFRTHYQPFPSGVDTVAMNYANRDPLDGSFPSLVADARNKATKRLYSKVDGVKVNLAQFLAERKQVADLLASTATRILQSARALKRADFRSFANALSLSRTETRTLKQSFEKVYRTPAAERLPRHWLEYVYGWRPLLSDCYEAASLLGEQLHTSEAPEGEIRTTATVRQSFQKVDWDGTGNGAIIVPTYHDTHHCKASIRVHYRLDSEARSLLNKTGISNPASLAWELLPWSFVVDWFVPVGTYLDSLTAMDGFTITRGSISTLEAAVSERHLDLINAGPFSGAHAKSWAVSSGVAVFASQRRYIRSPSVTFPYALKVRSPIGGEPLSRFVTAMSLLAGLFSGNTKPRGVT